MKFVFISNDEVHSIEDLESYELAAIKGRSFQAVIEIPDGEAVPEVGWKFKDGLILNPLIGTKKISRLKFLQRFTDAELVGIEAFSAGTGAHNIAVRVALRKQSLAEFIDLALPETISGTMAMAALGLITSKRAEEILNAPVNETERYKG